GRAALSTLALMVLHRRVKEPVPAPVVAAVPAHENLLSAMEENGQGARNVRASSRRKVRLMILYGSSMSPFVRKVIAYASEKGIELDIRPTGLGDPDPEFRKASPFGKMPGFADGDYYLADSSAIIHYLEAKH